jgi:hypothetical protein
MWWTPPVTRVPTQLWLLLVSLLVLMSVTTGCSTGVEPSPNPGLLRVLLTADPADREIVIVRDPVAVKAGDDFTVTVFQGKAFSDSTYFILFKDLNSYRQEDRSFNVLRPADEGFERYTVFESLLPPGRYDSLQFGVIPGDLKIDVYQIPVRMNPSARVLHTFETPFEVRENGITEVEVMIKPLTSVQRFRNSFVFDANIAVSEVRYE